MSYPKKIVVFDLDETLGNFVELGIFCDALSAYKKQEIDDNEFFELLDMFPEFLRPNIISILKYLLDKKKCDECSKIMIYTNNQGPRTWCENICKYIDLKTEDKTFDQIIAAFKVKGKIVEVGRNSHNKSIFDLINCTNLPLDTEICFLDDQYHPLMKGEKVFYINVKPYIHHIPFNDMAERYYNKKQLLDEHDKFIEFITNYMSRYNFTVKKKEPEDENIDKIISKKIIMYLDEFFKKNKSGQTRRHRRRKIKNKNTTKRSKS
mgnify:CR=1 FL=1